MFTLQKSKSKSSSRQQIGIKEVRNGILLLPGFEYRTIIEASAINFELMSDAEQDALIDGYQSFLNSIGTGIQIVVRTRQIEIDNYIANLSATISSDDKPINKQQLENYIDFIQTLVKDNQILSRRFFIVLSQKASRRDDFEFIQEQLQQKIDIVQKGLMRLGMQITPLGSLEVIDLFYSFYNQERAKRQPFTIEALHQIHQSFVRRSKV